MNDDKIQGREKQIRGLIQQEWGDLADAPQAELEGRIKRLMGTLQSQFGMAKDEAATMLNSVLDELGVPSRA